MARASLANRLRNTIGATLQGVFIAILITEFAVIDRWIAHAPSSPDPAHGLVHGFNQHGTLVYLSAAQSVGQNLPFLLLPVMVVTAMVVMPKKNIKTRFLRVTWDMDDPAGILLPVTLLSAAVTLLVFWLAGMDILTWIAGLGIGVSDDTP